MGEVEKAAAAIRGVVAVGEAKREGVIRERVVVRNRWSGARKENVEAIVILVGNDN